MFRGGVCVSVLAVFVVLATAAQPAEENREPQEPRKTPTLLEEVIVTATRTAKTLFDAPNTAQVLTARDVQERRLSRTVPDVLKETPGVMVQKTSHGQGSPFIRGFTGFRTLMLIDGIRLNNSVFRDGPNQYWNTVDPFTIDRMEIVKGPGSVLYGSDAVGGTVNVFTRGPEGYGEGLRSSRRLYYRYSTAEDSHVGRFDLDLTRDHRFGLHVGGSLKDFGDVEAGGAVGRQPRTGYDEWDADLKFEYFLDPDSTLTLAHQRVTQDNAWRTHKTIYGISWQGTTVGNELERSLDLERRLTYLQYHTEDRGTFIDAATATLSYHVQQEEQVRVRTGDRYDRQGFDVATLGASVQLETPSTIGRWTYGLEYYRDDVDSFADKLDADGTVTSSEIQGPVADDAAYDLLGVFIQDDVPLHERFDLILGARYTYAEADAAKVKDPETGDPTSVAGNWDTVVGSARVLVRMDERERWHLFGGVAQGFRAPNLSDLTRLDTARTNEIETAAPDLDPERFISYEIGVKSQAENFSGQFAYFYTTISDMIVRTPTGNIIDGNDEVTKKNAGDGFIHGVELSSSYRLHPQWSALGCFAWTDGEVDTFPTSDPIVVREPIDRIMPPTGILGIRWERPDAGCWVEALVTVAARQDDLSTRDAADTQRIPPDGTPGYTVFTLRGGWEIRENLTVSAAVENITDEDYRIHGSGQNEPGRNLIMTLDWRF